ncbi:DegT/DnrJ/EryC1/StrS family aminotransferase [bacterium]|nr:DegT/DnrJ/EryC1/StrS family aminotransferase [bacterium]
MGFSSKEHPISLHEPCFTCTQAWSYVKDCLDTGWVSTAGSWVCRFVQEISILSGAKHAVVVSSGTVALRLALHLVGVSLNDEVLLPPLSFVATANAVAQLNAVPHFVNVEPNALGMCPVALAARLEAIAVRRNGSIVNRETGRRIAAVLPVHIFGHPAEVDQLRLVAYSWGLPLVEDAAEALASWRGGIHCGLFGSVGTLSFNGNKLTTSGGGGALLTNDDNLAKRAHHLSTSAKQPHPWAFDHDVVGWNDRLPNLNAALGVAQLEDLNRRLHAKCQLACRYEEVSADV